VARSGVNASQLQAGLLSAWTTCCYSGLSLSEPWKILEWPNSIATGWFYWSGRGDL